MKYFLLVTLSTLELVGQAASVLEGDGSTKFCSVSGTAFSSATRQALGSTKIVIQPVNSQPTSSLVTITDVTGTFRLSGLPAGLYEVTALHDGFAPFSYGARGSGQRGSPIRCLSGDSIPRLDLALAPESSVSGRVFDEFGNPIASAIVQLFRSTYVDGVNRVLPAESTRTDAAGRYSVNGARPGLYYVIAYYQPRFLKLGVGEQWVGPKDLRSTLESGYIKTVYPRVEDFSAGTLLKVVPGNTIQGIDISLLTGHVVRVSGTIKGLPTGARESPPVVRLIPTRWSRDVSVPQTLAFVTADGRFGFTGVAAGAYAIAVSQGSLSCVRRFEVSGADIDDLELELTTTLELRGEVRGPEGQQVDMTRFRVSLQPLNDPADFGKIATADRTGAFVLSRLARDIYRVVVDGLPEHTYVKSISLGETSIEDVGLDTTGSVPTDSLIVRLGQADSQIEGDVRDQNGQPAYDALVVLAPASPRREDSRYKLVRTDSSGRFVLTSVALGKYKVFVCAEGQETCGYRDPNFMKQIQETTADVTAGENGYPEIHLVLASGG
jgi:hypothetical protein